MNGRGFSRRRAAAVLALAWALGGCNALIGLDDVNVRGTGASSGGGGTTGAQGGGGTTTPAGGTTGTLTGGAGGETGTLTGGAGGTTGPLTGGAGGPGGAGGAIGTGAGGEEPPPCAADADCAPPLVCDPATGTCVAPTCGDSKKDGDETGPDCGGPACPPCADGLGCAAPKDCASGVCAGTCQSPQCGDGVVNGAEDCDDDDAYGGDGCSASCAIEPGYVCSGDMPSVCWPDCGDGLVLDVEQCDDGNGASGDGCSAGCDVEPLYQCRTEAPPVCTEEETRCDNGADDDADGLTDWDDPDCDLPPYMPQLGCASWWIYHSVNVPLGVPDDAPGAESTIVVPDDFGVAHMSVLLELTHPRDSDLVVTLHPPFGQPRTLTNGNGGNGSSYHDTLFDSTCALSVTMGAAPFLGCFKPQSFFPNAGQPAKGKWTLEVEDKASGQSGTLDGWMLVLCGP